MNKANCHKRQGFSADRQSDVRRMETGRENKPGEEMKSSRL
jgi:hypothetical protein